MNLDEKVRYLKNAIDDNKLIIFVGAGISKNSNLPDWEQLIKVFANKLKYPIKEGQKLSSDEFLKIPQYYYNIFGAEEYKKVIKQELDINGQPNEIHELIFKLNPKHIITTNYDKLLEHTIIEQRMLFDIIAKDKDLLDSKKSNYIIKMHGDIKDLDNIVLKENDYLNYSQNHILIETYIKSLLVCNTFLFIGYSLNDYNLKQIISWVDYLAKSYTDIKDRPKSFIVQEVKEKYRKFTEDYYEKNNLFIINPQEIDKANLECIETELSDEFGKRLYGTLMYIKDYPQNIIDKFYYQGERFKNLRKISINDLFSIYRFKSAEVLGGSTLCFYRIDSKESVTIMDIINGKNDKEKFVQAMFIKSGIKYIYIQDNIEFKTYYLPDDYIRQNDLFYEFNELEIKCNYKEISERINSINDTNIKAFYLFKLQEFDEARKCLEELKESILNKDIYNLLLYKFNLGLLNQLMFRNNKSNYDDFSYIYENIAKKTMYELNYLNDIFNNNPNQKLELSRLKEKHMKIYLKLDNSVQIGGNIKDCLYKMKTIVYDYYFYIKENGLYLDYFSDMDNFFEPYIEAIISTYSPKTKRVRTNILFPDDNEYESYILNIYDLDIIIKHSNYKKIKELFEKYEMKEILYEDNINVIEMLENLCVYITLRANIFNVKYLKKLLLLLTIIDLKKEDVNRVVRILENVLINSNGNLNCYIFSEIGEDLISFINRNIEAIAINSFELIIDELFTEKVYNQLKEDNKTRDIFKFLNSVNAFSYDLYKNKIDNIIENIIKNNNIEYIYGLSKSFSNEQKEKISENILNNLNSLNINTIIEFILNDLIEYNEIIENKIISEADLHVSSKKQQIGFKLFPDPLKILLEKVIVLFLSNKGVNIFKFEKYIEYNDVLFFIINPSKFDYEKIELDNFNWMNIMRKKEYLKIIIDNGKNIVNKKLKDIIKNEFANENQTRLYYKYFE
ncbi:SIR2 family protein [Clostridium perfringens]|uniref:SIR2 family protein n=3 Tax=Clostridium perfringens TaxID=1502 RepID=UPI00130483C5|nr:SIR2 family protein [Clostridium perfringens]ELC8392176.1 SIR2 family protein [Clostridium perfringens]